MVNYENIFCFKYKSILYENAHKITFTWLEIMIFIMQKCTFKKKYLLSIKVHFSFRFCLLNVLSLYSYTTAFQKVDDEEFGGAWELIKEGFMTSFASFLVR